VTGGWKPDFKNRFQTEALPSATKVDASRSPPPLFALAGPGARWLARANEEARRRAAFPARAPGRGGSGRPSLARRNNAPVAESRGRDRGACLPDPTARADDLTVR